MTFDNYAYLLLGLFFLALWLGAYFTRKDLRGMMWVVSLCGAICGPITEIWFFRDYWLPPTIFFNPGVISLEDVLFGFAAFGVAFAAYPVLFRKSFTNTHKQRRIILPLFAISFFPGFFLFTDAFDINSIYAASITMLLWTANIGIKRRDLILPSLINGVLLAGFSMIIYLALLGIAVEYLSRYWLLYNTPLGNTLIGVPVTELVWYFCLGASTLAVTAVSEGKSLSKRI